MLLQGKNAQGFTLIELIAVVVLLSVLGVLAFARLGSFGGIEIRAFYDEVVAAVRYAQKLAVSTGCDVQVSLSATGYSLQQRQTDCTTGDFTRAVLDPSERSQAFQNSHPDVSVSPTAQLVFTSDSTVSTLAADQTFSLNGRTFTVFQLTGLVDAQ